MKKNLLRIFCLMLVLTVLVGVLPALAADEISVFVNVSAGGHTALTKDGKPAVMMEVKDGKYEPTRKEDVIEE